MILELEFRERYATDFSTFIKNVDEDFPLDEWHTQKVISALDRVVSGELKRLMIFMPPGYRKSTTVSRLFPPYYLSKFPTNRFLLACYSQDLANTMSKKARANYEKTGRRLSQDSSAIHAWDTEEGGGFLSLGVGGTITGKRGDILVLDDYMKSKKEAYSQPFRDEQWDWWKWVWYQRKEQDSAFIVMATRWNMDDIVGRLLEQEKISPEHWHIINLQGKRDIANEMKFPETCTVEEDPRADGEPLCVRIHTQEQLKNEELLDPGMFSAMFQQNPVLESGEIWHQEMFKAIADYQLDEMILKGEVLDLGKDWDLAYTKDENNSACAKIKSGVGRDGAIYIDDVEWRWNEFSEMLEWIEEEPTVPNYIEQKASGKSAAQMLSKVGIYAAEVPVKGGDKIGRARIASLVARNRIIYVRASIRAKLLFDPKQGLINFPASSHDDVNDAVVQALNRLWPFTKEVKKVSDDEEEWFIRAAREEGYTPVQVSNWRDAFNL